jgi:hypothetical protein
MDNILGIKSKYKRGEETIHAQMNTKDVTSV